MIWSPKPRTSLKKCFAPSTPFSSIYYSWSLIIQPFLKTWWWCSKYTWLIASALQLLFGDPCNRHRCLCWERAKISCTLCCWVAVSAKCTALISVMTFFNWLSVSSVFHAVSVRLELAFAACNSRSPIAQATAHYTPPCHIAIIVLDILVITMRTIEGMPVGAQIIRSIQGWLPT